MAQVARLLGVEIEQESQGTVIRVRPVNRADHAERESVEEASPEPIQPPLDHREELTMETLVEVGVGVKTYWSLIRWCDPHTRRKLDDRGYILSKPPSRRAVCT